LHGPQGKPEQKNNNGAGGGLWNGAFAGKNKTCIKSICVSRPVGQAGGGSRQQRRGIRKMNERRGDPASKKGGGDKGSQAVGLTAAPLAPLVSAFTGTGFSGSRKGPGGKQASTTTDHAQN